MGEIAASSSSWRKGGWAITLEEHRRQQPQAPKPPTRGTPIGTGADRPEPVQDWRDRARCRLDAKPVSWFFPEPGDQTTSRIARYCSGCDVRAECRAFAVEAGLWVGWYGGESPKQRANKAQKWSGPDRAHGTAARAQYGARGFEKGNGCLCRPCSDAWAVSKAKEAERNRRKNRVARENQRVERDAARAAAR